MTETRASRAATGDQFIFRGYIDGLTTAWVSNTTFSVSAGVCADSTNTVMMNLPSSITKSSAGTWVVGTNQNGLDTGTIANSTWYHIYAIMRPDTGVTDILFSTSASSPTLPSNYTYFRRIGSLKTNGSAQFLSWKQVAGVFKYTTAILDRNSTSALADTQFTFSVPLGVITQPIITLQLNVPSGANISQRFGDGSAGATQQTVQQPAPSASSQNEVMTLYGGFYTDTSSRLWASVVIGAGSITGNAWNTLGWIDNRGENQ